MLGSCSPLGRNAGLLSAIRAMDASVISTMEESVQQHGLALLREVADALGERVSLHTAC